MEKDLRERNIDESVKAIEDFQFLDPNEEYLDPDADQIDQKDNTIEVQDWPSYIKFCAPGGYKHCGPGCGDGLSYGGGTPINATDSCCRGHDRCYKNFPNNKSCCDKQLVDCVRTHTTATIIRTVFAGGRC